MSEEKIERKPSKHASILETIGKISELTNIEVVSITKLE